MGLWQGDIHALAVVNDRQARFDYIPASAGIRAFDSFVRLAEATKYIYIYCFAFVTGCSNGGGGEKPSTAQSATEAEGNRSLTPTVEAVVDRFDYGFVLARGQELCHEFIYHNDESRPIRILSAVALTPCCSRIEAAPDPVAPGGEAILRTWLTASKQSEKKRAEFIVRTDSHLHPQSVLAVEAEFEAGWEVHELKGSDHNVIAGRSGTQTFRIVYRSVGDGQPSRGAPSMTASPPLSARLVRRPRERLRRDGVTESACEVVVDIPRQEEPGRRSGAVRFTWDGGREETLAVHWTVRDGLSVAPSGLVVDDPERAYSLVVTSDDRPFRILSIECDAVVGEPTLDSAPARSHALSLRFLPNHGETVQVSNLYVNTDRAVRPRIAVSIFQPPSRKESIQ